MTQNHSSHGRRAACLVIAAVVSVLLASCAGAVSGGELDLARLKLTAEQERELERMHEAAIKSGETDISLYAGHHDEYTAIYKDFEKRFPGLTISPETYAGAELQTALESERTSGRRVADVISNPNADRYAQQGFAQPYRVVTFTMPEWANGRISKDQLAAPDHTYYSPWSLMFCTSYNTKRMTEAELPKSWDALAGPEWSGKLTFMDPSVPGGTMTVLTVLLNAGVVDHRWLEAVGKNTKIVAQDQLALQSVSSGEFPFQPLSATTSIVHAQRDGAPVSAHFFPENNVIATEKWMLAAGAPSSDAAKVLLNYLHTVDAQRMALESGNFPTNQDKSLSSPHGWPSLAQANFVPLPAQALLRKKMDEFGPIFKRVTAG
ncbi:MAG: extracellular solute-binding protein [Pseudonocardiaceae bacterium]|nr:extracellular solute-binding protein [Pseudonocardiaceae bacterium]